MKFHAVSLLFVCFHSARTYEHDEYCLDFHNISECLANDNAPFKPVKINTSWTGPIATTSSAGNRIYLNYSIILDATKCCPGIVVFSEPLKEDLVENGCLDIPINLLEQMYLIGNYLSIDWKFYGRFLNRKCKPPDKKELYTCYGTFKVDFSEPKLAQAYIFYPCEAKQDINLIVDVSFSVKNETYPCHELSPNHTCHKYYSCVHTPNLIGTRRYSRAALNFAALEPFVSSGCHQHFEEFLCRTVLPESTKEGYVAPCKAMCEEILSFSPCTDVYQAGVVIRVPREYFNLFGILFCMEFPTSADCFFKKVRCKQPPKVAHSKKKHDLLSTASFASTLEYTCEKDYEIEGNDTIFCQYSGKWSDPPVCLLKKSTRDLKIISSVFGTFTGFLLFAIILCARYRKELVVMIYDKFGIRFVRTQEDNLRYDAFIGYEENDFPFVRKELLTPLEILDPPFKICVEHRDFDIGVTRIKTS